MGSVPCHSPAGGTKVPDRVPAVGVPGTQLPTRPQEVALSGRPAPWKGHTALCSSPQPGRGLVSGAPVLRPDSAVTSRPRGWVGCTLPAPESGHREGAPWSLGLTPSTSSSWGFLGQWGTGRVPGCAHLRREQQGQPSLRLGVPRASGAPSSPCPASPPSAQEHE